MKIGSNYSNLMEFIGFEDQLMKGIISSTPTVNHDGEGLMV